MGFIRDGLGGGGGGGGLHVEQYYIYYWLLWVGDVLMVIIGFGNMWEKQGCRGGKLVFSEMVIEYRDQQGELVVIVWGVGVCIEKVVEQEG